MDPFQSAMDGLQRVTTVQNPGIMVRVLRFPGDKLVMPSREDSDKAYQTSMAMLAAIAGQRRTSMPNAPSTGPISPSWTKMWL